MERESDYELIDDTASKQFRFEIGDRIAKIDSIKAKDKIYHTHTQVPKELEGKVIGSELVRKVLIDIESKGLTLIPLCPFVATYIKKHPEWRKLVLISL